MKSFKVVGSSYWDHVQQSSVVRRCLSRSVQGIRQASDTAQRDRLRPVADAAGTYRVGHVKWSQLQFCW